ncbi:HAMP domain-containing sensor histidine kinase [Bifidobacterium sp. ESL0784]|uniref:HAMP domain-containing sensor histidine kinase n=1 Tax=Bifidobacterium sp. ESL0784 TaxID=2983231 RepID=UPI0023F71AE3|nr:HAMP domain-containing sensor histidine kinase [Bifidobacterium sp. ESL0784]MDF7641108.1 HAMP domain-containing sensor histidine kinase [Bifidobacterium sp. ESL0784]
MSVFSGRTRNNGKTTRFVQPISLLIIRYFLYILVGLAGLAMVYAILFSNLVVIWPSSWANNHIDATMDSLTLKPAREVNDDDIPSAYHWQTMTKQGEPIAGDMSPQMTSSAHKVISLPKQQDESGKGFVSLVDGRLSDASTLFYRGFRLADGNWCVLAYGTHPQFVSRQWRDHLPNPDILASFIGIAVCTLLVVGVAIRAGRSVTRRLRPLRDAAECVQNGDLHFVIAQTDVREVNVLLHAFGDMRDALNRSLTKQREARQTQERQISALTHDIKTPLTIIRGNAELLQETPLDGEQQTYAASISEASQRVDGYVQEVLDITVNGAESSKTQTFDRGRDLKSPDRDEKAELVPVRWFVSQLLGEARQYIALTDLQVRIVEHGIDGFPEDIDSGTGITGFDMDDTEIRSISSTTYVFINRQEVTRAFMNIVSNGVSYAPKYSAITIVIVNDKQDLLLNIRDDGPGFSEEALRHGTEWLYQGDRSRSDSAHHGMGLTTAAAIIERNQGHLTLENQSQGGASVTISLPIRSEETA